MTRLLTLALVRPERRGPDESVCGYLARVGPLFGRCAQAHADIACLPEDFASLGADAEPADGPVGSFMANAAKQHGLHVLGGLSEVLHGGRANSALLFGPDGNLIGRYRKIHCTRVERETFGHVPGDDLPVFETRAGRIGVMLCFDAYFPEVAGILARRGADVIFCPNQFNVPHEAYYVRQMQVRAQDNCVYIAANSWGGAPGTPWTPEMGEYASIVVDRDGEILARSTHDAGVLVATVDLDRRCIMRNNVVAGDHDFADTLARFRRGGLYQRLDCAPPCDMSHQP